MEITAISTGFLSGNLFCGDDEPGMDEHASTNEYARLLKLQVEQTYPGVEVSVGWQDAEGCLPSSLATYAVFAGDSSYEQRDEIDMEIKRIQENLYESGDWCINV